MKLLGGCELQFAKEAYRRERKRGKNAREHEISNGVTGAIANESALFRYLQLGIQRAVLHPWSTGTNALWYECVVSLGL